MPRIIFIILVILATLSLAFDAPETTASGQVLGGEWIRVDGEAPWYLHSEAEFLGIDCDRCHEEMSKTVWLCPKPDKICSFIVNENGELVVWCSNGAGGPSL